MPSRQPLWQQVLADLEARLERGEIADRFPTDRELVEHYGVSRHTVREAVRRLRARGVVERYRGRGSFVRDRQLHQSVGTLYSLFRAVEDRGHEQRSEVLAFDRRSDREVAGEFGLPHDTDLIRLERVRFVDDEPLAIDTAWLPADVAGPVLEADMRHTALYHELAERCGLRLTAVEEVIEPIVPDDDIRELLGLEEDEALFRIERRGFVGQRQIEWRVTLVRGRRFAFVSTWTAADQNSPLHFEARN